MSTRILIVGCGAVTQEAHAPALRRLEQTSEATVVGLCDPSESNAATLQPRFRQPKYFPDLDAVPPNFADIALVASPVRYHSAQTIRCLEAGMAVLCEKPMAASSEEARAMNDAARTHGRLLAIGQIRRFFAAADFIRAVVTDQRFGRLLSFSIREGGRFGWSARTDSFFDKQTSGGGVLIDTGIHTLDLVLWWFGEPETFVYADDRMGGLETTCRVQMNYSGFSGLVQLSRDYEIPNCYRLEFEHAWITWAPYAARQIEVGFRGLSRALSGELASVQENTGSLPPRYTTLPPFEQMFLIQWRNVLAAVEGRETVRVPGETAARSLAFIERCYQNRTFLPPPWLGAAELARARDLNRL